ncbi:MAG: hypothetical protein K1X57_18035 [Gemmataceae bacterium]|nr:hypothetical protein [Gemmataceae bacterium]
MLARNLIAGILFCALVGGCGKEKPRTAAEEAETRKAMENYARDRLPVLDRGIVMQELEQLHLYFYTAYTASGKWPKDLSAAKEMMQRDADMRKLYQKVEDGTYVIVGNPPEGGILAYCTKETTVGLISVSTNKDFNQHKPDDLKKLLAQQKR